MAITFLNKISSALSHFYSSRWTMCRLHVQINEGGRRIHGQTTTRNKYVA